jgi:hypothetical protein
MKKVILIVFVACIAAGCTKNAGPAQTEAQKPETLIQMAIESHLAHRETLNLQAFDTNVKQVTIQGDHATAEVEFRVKGGPGAMQLTYALEKRDGAWSVIDSDPGGTSFSHPSPNQGQAPDANNLPGANHSLDDTLRFFKRKPPPSQR